MPGRDGSSITAHARNFGAKRPCARCLFSWVRAVRPNYINTNPGGNVRTIVAIVVIVVFTSTLVRKLEPVAHKGAVSLGSSEKPFDHSGSPINPPHRGTLTRDGARDSIFEIPKTGQEAFFSKDEKKTVKPVLV